MSPTASARIPAIGSPVLASRRAVSVAATEQPATVVEYLTSTSGEVYGFRAAFGNYDIQAFMLSTNGRDWRLPPGTLI